MKLSAFKNIAISKSHLKNIPLLKGAFTMTFSRELFSFLLLRLGVIVAISALWQGLAWIIASPDFPSLVAVINSVQYHLNEGDMVSNVVITLRRVLLSFIIAMLLGGIIGIMMGVNAWINKLSDSLLIIMLNIPALVLSLIHI